MSWLSLVCRAVYLWIQNEDLVNDWLEVLHFLSSSDHREAIWDPGTLLVYSNDQSARQGSDSVDASNFLQHNGSPPLPFLCLFCCLLPQTDNWFVLISWASFPDDSSSCFGRQALWGNPFFFFYQVSCSTLGDACQSGRCCVGLGAQNSCSW